MNHFINTAATDISRARTTGLAQLTPEPFPILLVGTKPPAKFFFTNRGTLEDWSGSLTYNLRLTIGSVTGNGPIGNTFSLTVGSEDPITLPYDIDQAGLQNALNDSATIASEGGVEVTAFGYGTGKFLVAYKALGAVESITASAATLAPDCTAEVVTLTEGSVSTRQLLSLEIQRTVPLSTTAFTATVTPYDGWEGFIDLTSSAAFQFVMLNGVPRGQYVEANTLLTLDVIDGEGNPACYYQTAVTLRVNNFMLTQLLAVGPSANAQATTSAGTITVVPESQIHTETVTVTGLATTRNIVLTQPDGMMAGARVDVVVLFPVGATNGTLVNLYLNEVSGSPISSFSRSGDEPNALWSFSMNEGVTAFQLKQVLIPAFYA